MLINKQLLAHAVVLNYKTSAVSRQCLHSLDQLSYSEHIFMYIEDADMDYRAWQAG
ncbi:MAG: hypothetical protein ACKVZH_29265 [Blastocatellia bacterium]